ncbi:hypothetical protein EPN44_02785 [bacterium]|nr:MAG: hypothetical protein EPN44_02785 [bacterium]
MPVPQAHTVTVYYSPPPAGALNVSPTYLEWHPDSGLWESQGNQPLPTGGAISAAESWYARPWTVTQGGCSEPTVGAVAPSSAYGFSGLSGPPWSLASAPHKSPASPWTSGPFAGTTTGYSDGAFDVVAGNLGNTQPVTCGLTVTSTDAKSVDVTVVIDPERCLAGYTGTPPNCVLPTPTPTPAPTATPKPVTLALNAASNATSGGSCVQFTRNQTIGPIAASQMPLEGAPDTSGQGWPFPNPITLGAPFQTAYMDTGLYSPGLDTDQTSWDALLAQTGGLAGNTQVYVNTTATIYPACGGGN